MLSHDEIQSAISARLDGEPAGLDDAVIDAHVQACPECSAFQTRAAHLSAALMYVESPHDGMSPPPDLADTILAGVDPQWRRGMASRRAWLATARVVLVVLAVLYAVWAVRTVGATDGVAPVGADGLTLDPQAHPETVRALIETAGLRFSLAVGLAMCAWRPQLIAGFIVIPATLAAFLVGFTARDVVLGWFAPGQLLSLVVLVVTVFTLVAAWVADQGLVVSQAWRALRSDPL
ncbi:zf-HC2 domain-containing protein [Corynebacterium uterequi]|uniref:Putative integral membrane protein n=1 Tax=Corynebacterium uterequi TaxID=1072256 RepID=A0A0G3HDE2_9CORY|nr:zf-HC2 domain-containing protein [Corynebacterium uterequi]AKK10710.1 putative integral membrane protein [Corynebacterium uterequi]